jgi:hypothetical protein
MAFFSALSIQPVGQKQPSEDFMLELTVRFSQSGELNMKILITHQGFRVPFTFTSSTLEPLNY